MKELGVLVLVENSKKITTTILICGKASSGKSTLAHALETLLNDNKRVTCLARNNGQTVKDIAVNQFMWNTDKDYLGRQLLINITSTGYSYDPYMWEKHTEKSFYEVKKVFPNLKTLIVPDWRYPQTKTFFESISNKVITIRLINPNTRPSGHEKDPSEIMLDTFNVDLVIYNEGKSLDELNAIAKNLIRMYDLK